jgi:dolichol-phosphate mannosyltransferase
MIWLVLPAYNEAENLAPLLERVWAAWTGRFPYTVVVVDDGSLDDTASVANAARVPVHVVKHVQNKGLAAAIRSGFGEVCGRAADNDVIVTMDADNSHPPELVPLMLDQLEDHDLVIASRFVRGGSEKGVPWQRRALSRAAAAVFKYLCPIDGVRDYTSGFRAYRAKLIKELWRRHGSQLIEATAFSVMTEVLLKARQLQPRVTEVPLALRYDLKSGRSKMRLGRTLRDYGAMLRREFGARELKW